MSAKKIKVTRWECRCENKTCPSKGEPWITRTERLPEICPTCKNRSFIKKATREKLKSIPDSSVVFGV